MKKLIVMLAISVIGLIACNKENEMPGTTDDSSDVSEIKLSLYTGGDGLSTKTARPLQSSEAYSTVNKIILKIYEGTDETATEVTSTILPAGADVISWTNVSIPVGPGTTTNPQSQAVQLKALAASKNYTVIAYGFNGESNALSYSITGDGKVADGFTATLQDGNTEEEIFAGITTFATGTDKRLSKK